MAATVTEIDGAAVDAELGAALAAAGRVIRAPAAATLFGPGAAPSAYLLALSGTVRVRQIAENGREILLYRIGPGESCPLTTACLLADDAYAAEAIAETDVEVLAIGRADFDALVARSAMFRRLVFAAHARRFTELFHVIEEIAFRRVDLRLAEKLLERADAEGRVLATHQALAAELGTAREVVSRHVAELARRGFVAAARGEIRLVDRGALARLVAAR